MIISLLCCFTHAFIWCAFSKFDYRSMKVHIFRAVFLSMHWMNDLNAISHMPTKCLENFPFDSSASSPLHQWRTASDCIILTNGMDKKNAKIKLSRILFAPSCLLKTGWQQRSCDDIISDNYSSVSGCSIFIASIKSSESRFNR